MEEDAAVTWLIDRFDKSRMMMIAPRRSCRAHEGLCLLSVVKCVDTEECMLEPVAQQ